MYKKTFITFFTCSILINAQSQNKPPIRIPSQEAKISIAKKISEATVSSKCTGLAEVTPTKITSSTGSTGYYSDCTTSNAVIFYLVNQRVSVFNYGDIRTKYATQDFERGPLGFPLQDVKGIAGLRGGYQVFEGGAIYEIFHASPDKKSSASFIIKGGFYKKFLALGGDKVIGLPISDEEDDKSAGGEAGDKFSRGIISQSFEKGTITKKGNAMAYRSYDKKPSIKRSHPY